MKLIPALLAALVWTTLTFSVAGLENRVAASERLSSLLAVASQKREVVIKATDGVILKGTYYSAAKPGPGILLHHMCDGSGRAAWESLANHLAQEGFHVLTFNYRGVGDSGGEKFAGGSLQEVMTYWRTKWGPDVEAALSFLLSQPDVNRQAVGAGGASCGVYMSLQLAQRHPDLVKSLVLMAGPTDEEAQAFVTRSARLPILSVASEDDHRSAEWMTNLSTISKHRDSKLIMYKNAGHGTRMFEKEKDLEPLIVQWFKNTLR